MNDIIDSSLYDILGVDKNSKLETIKKAYKNLAIKYHPDKNINNKDFCKEDFINITNAYNIIADSFNQNSNNTQNSNDTQNYNYNQNLNDDENSDDNQKFYDNYKDLNNATEFFKIFMNNEINEINSKKKTDKLNLFLDLEDIYNGCNKKIIFNRLILCKYCKGSGSLSLKEKQNCNRCSGLGITTIIKQNGNNLNEINIPCNKCNGYGKISKKGDDCKFCNSKGMYKKNDTINVNIEKGYDKNIINLKKMGNFNIDIGFYNDLEISIKIKEHPIFKLKKNDLIVKHKISLCNALVDNFIIITHLDKRKIYAKTDNLLLKNRLKYIKNEGMPIYNLPGNRGNLIIKITIKYPEKIDLSKVKFLKKIIPYVNYNLSDDFDKKQLIDNL